MRRLLCVGSLVLLAGVLSAQSSAMAPWFEIADVHRRSDESGGSFFEVSKKQTIDQVFGILEQELRTQYSFGYVSDKPVTISEFRSIQLTTREKGLIVQARHRYWARV